MALNKAKKVEVVKTLGERLSAAETVAFVNFHGLSVAGASALRRSLRERGVGYTVARKTLIKRALGGLAKKPEGEMPNLEGEIAVSYGLPAPLAQARQAGQDQIWPAKGVHEFGQKSGGLKIVGGIFEGRYLGAEAMQALARIPDREALYGQLLNLIQWPMRSLVMTLSEISKNKN